MCALLGMLAACGGSNSNDSASATDSSTTSSFSPGTGSSTAAPLVALTSSSYSAAASSTAIVAIYRTGNPTGAATVGYTTVNGTARAGTDYTATGGTVTWSDGETAVKTVAVPVTSQAAGKEFAVALTSVEGQASFGSPTSATVAVALTPGSASPSVSTGVGVAVSGNTFINTATGKPVVLAGANLDGLDGSGGYGGAGQINQWNIIAGITPAQWAAIAAKWGINTIRLPMNSAYWLNNTVYDDPAAAAIDTGACCYTSIGTGEYTPDASGTYQSVIATIVSNITAAGIVVGLDLHCDAPKNSSGQYIACVGETALPSVDSALPFWTQVANTFKSNPLVIFGLYNEPYGGYNYNSAPGAVIGGGTSAVPGATAVTMITGGPLAPFTMLASDQTLVTLSGGAALNTIGMVDLITAIRNTGATNVILAPPIWYSGQIQTWLDSYTTTTYGRTSAGNPDPIGQLGVDWHDYGWSSGTLTPLAILAAGYPILMTETYGFDSALDGGSNASGYTWAASNGIGVQVWAWATWASGGASSSTAFYNYLLSTPPWAEGGAAAPTGNTFGQSPL